MVYSYYYIIKSREGFQQARSLWILFEQALARAVLTLSYLSVAATVGFYSSSFDNNMCNDALVAVFTFATEFGNWTL